MSFEMFPALALAAVLMGCVESTAAPTTATLPSVAPASVKLMTYNVNYGNFGSESSLAAIEEADADLVLLQEITDAWRDRLEQRFAKQYAHRKYRIVGRAAGGLAILSKLPIQREELWAAPAGTGAYFPAQRFFVELAIGPVQVLNVHLRPAIEGGSWVKGFFTTPPYRRAEMEAHWNKLDKSLPTIVAGDFNEDADGRALDFLAGHGLARIPTTGPTTWHYQTRTKTGLTDVLRMDIDHVVVDRRFFAKDAHVMDAGTSDHRPVVVTLATKP